MKKQIILLISFLCLMSCAHKEVESEPQNETSNIPEALPPAPAPVKHGLDIEEVEKKLNLAPVYDQLGFHEKKFNPCLLGFKGIECTPQLFTMINFKVVCRDTDETTESSDHVLTPFAGKSVSLKVGSHTSESATDSNGYGTIKFTTKTSARGFRFILSSPPNSLGLRAGEVKQIIVPNDWCQ